MVGWSSKLATVAIAVSTYIASAAPATAETLVSVAVVERIPVLVEFDSERPFFPTSLRIIRGVTPGQKIVALDARPLDNTLYAVGVRNTTAQLYIIDRGTGNATAVGAAYTELVNSPRASFGFDFNPVIDRIRLVSSSGQNIVFNPDTGEVTAATDLAYGVGDANEGTTPSVSAIAYDNSVNGATETQQRGLDLETSSLVTVDNNAGTLGTIGSLAAPGVEVVSAGGFDISGDTGVGYALVKLSRVPVQLLVTIDLTTGAGTFAGIPALGSVELKGLAVIAEPQPE